MGSQKKKNRAEPKITFQVPPGQKPLTQEQIQEMQKKLAEDAAKNGMSVPEFVEKIKAQAAAQAATQQHQQSQPDVSPIEGNQLQQIQPGPPTPSALAVAKFLKNQDLKVRTCILGGRRKEMFRVKRAFRALESPAYKEAQKKNPLLPEITDRSSLENTFKLLPLSFLALQVSKVDPCEDSCNSSGSHSHSKTKRIKGLWTVEIEQQQECREDLHFVWLYEGPQIKQKLYATGAIASVFIIVMFPLWPIKLRLGVWYLSMGMLVLIGLFFAMAIFRLILFIVTMFAVPPGLWLYPNLFEDVGFFDSFRPVWGWQKEKKKKGKKKSQYSGSANAGATMAAMTGQPAPASATTSSAATQIKGIRPKQRKQSPTVKVEDFSDE
ncbi:Translocation protein SEC62 [Erysiphe neolycopersici]|uniref:Translocation protein SEC62 n=1 Tax=Erysiphe neolycopersici TaxID=212602 RepID=A0A420HLM4_9PEZI|nr:Translocation protein SEC62 [Erysiphe neolycopersici]